MRQILVNRLSFLPQPGRSGTGFVPDFSARDIGRGAVRFRPFAIGFLLGGSSGIHTMPDLRAGCIRSKDALSRVGCGDEGTALIVNDVVRFTHRILRGLSRNKQGSLGWCAPLPSPLPDGARGRLSEWDSGCFRGRAKERGEAR